MEKAEIEENHNNEVAVEERMEKRIGHYSGSQKMLLVGEGDFSFSACLATAFGSASNMVATSLDSFETVKTVYMCAEQMIKKLGERGCTVMHGVDAHTMKDHPKLRDQLFDRIIFNFPHDNSFWPFREHSQFSIQNLVSGFFKSTRNMIVETGQVHVTHKTAYPFDMWRIDKLAEEAGLVLLDKVAFYSWDYPGYINRKGYGFCWNDTFPIGLCNTFMFGMSKS